MPADLVALDVNLAGGWTLSNCTRVTLHTAIHYLLAIVLKWLKSVKRDIKIVSQPLSLYPGYSGPLTLVPVWVRSYWKPPFTVNPLYYGSLYNNQILYNIRLISTEWLCCSYMPPSQQRILFYVKMFGANLIVVKMVHCICISSLYVEIKGYKKARSPFHNLLYTLHL